MIIWLKMAWDWQLSVAETANLSSCSRSVVWKSPDGGLWSAAPDSHVRDILGIKPILVGQVQRVELIIALGSCRAFTEVGARPSLHPSCFYQSDYSLYCHLPLPSCSSYQGKHFKVPDAILLFGLETLYYIAFARKCVDVGQNRHNFKHVLWRWQESFIRQDRDPSRSQPLSWTSSPNPHMAVGKWISIV